MGKPSSREEVQFHHLKDLGGLEMLQARYHQQRFSRHSHENFCIGVIEEGAQRFYRTGGEHVAPTGDIILVNADEVHTGHAEVASGWSYRAIYPSPDLLCHLSRDLRVPQGATPWFPDAVLHDPGLSAQLRLAFTLLPQAGNSLLKETLLFSSLSWLMMRYSKTRADGRTLPAASQSILRAKAWLDECPEQDISLLQLAEAAGLSPWHFLRQFKALLGMTPHAYLVQARLRQARSLLINGISLSDTASQCGFSDQSHFNRHFKRTMGITPGEFVRTLK
ncbi:AraC family transcriptional regulator [Dickeya undicola]|uniref:Arabinose operon regulatory protein n=1 Tax=Dickeya undicola TaxID=1577887 RepID=A0A3N0GA02_9GAMM|nr:AraC family transcriptional regulator [Dickeya undicola]RNM09307.1 AraC family transcriptional regulator [Dickeya undicola]RNM26857.1 AraC family transcriptional regulator [Dickeya undicola]